MLTPEQSMESITPVIRYIESYFEKVQSNASTDSDVLNMLGGAGGSQVDVVLYLIQNSKAFNVFCWTIGLMNHQN